MAKTPTPLTSRKIKKLAEKAFKSPSMLTTEETRELGGSVLAHLQPDAIPAKKSAKDAPAKKA
jgi:hypothetical protein